MPVRQLGAFLLLAAIACGDDFAAVQKTDTIEAYEAYLQENPESRYALAAVNRLETLYLEAARTSETLEAYDRYLERFPDGAMRPKALEEREIFLFDWATRENTEAAWKRFLDEYPNGNRDRKVAAKRMMEVHGYLDHLHLTEPTIAQVNLAEDPEGPLNGWGFQVQVTNKGDRTIESLHLTIEYLADNGRAIDKRAWPVVAPYWNVPIEEWRKEPLKPGDTKPWDWTSGDLPETWEKKVRVYPSRIAFVDQSP